VSKILVVEDDKDQQELIRTILAADHITKILDDANDLLETVKSFQPELILLDIELPGVSGIEACQKLQTMPETSNIPLVFLTAKTSTADLVLGLSAGADDYIKKPFDPMELKARLETKIKKTEHKIERAKRIIKGDLCLDLPSQRAHISKGNREEVIDLTPLEFKLLCFLASREGEVLTRSQILENVWGEQALGVSNRTIDTHLSTLKKKNRLLSDFIQSVYGEGYRFDSTKKRA
jgi:DNA-binding response OmpR family regulator